MPIPFIRTFPNGRRVLSTIDRPGVAAIANVFVHAGGRYEVAVDEEGLVRLRAILVAPDGEEIECAYDSCTNTRVLPHKVDELVRDSVKWLALAGKIARESSIIADVNTH